MKRKPEMKSFGLNSTGTLHEQRMETYYYPESRLTSGSAWRKRNGLLEAEPCRVNRKHSPNR